MMISFSLTIWNWNKVGPQKAGFAQKSKGTFLGNPVFCWRINTLFLFYGFARQELCERDRKWQFSCWLVYFSNTTSQFWNFYQNSLNNMYFLIWRFYISQTQPHNFDISTQTSWKMCISQYEDLIFLTQPQNLTFSAKTPWGIYFARSAFSKTFAILLLAILLSLCTSVTYQT